MFVGLRAHGGRGPGLGTNPEEAPGPPLDGVGLYSDSNGYGSDIEKGVCSERLRGAKKPHHGLQVYITTPSTCRIYQKEPVLASCSGYIFTSMIMIKVCFFSIQEAHPCAHSQSETMAAI